jgi:hypothetical protein
MVWARTRLLIWDYVFEPVKEIRISFTGKNPDKFYKKLHELFRLVFNVPEGYIQEKDYKWEKSRGVERFDVSWEITRIFDVFSYLAIEVDMRGFSTEGEGRVNIAIKPRLITEYPQDTIWQQSIFYEMMRRMWHRLFYHGRRMQFLDYSKEMVMNFERQVKDFTEELKAAS